MKRFVLAIALAASFAAFGTVNLGAADNGGDTSQLGAGGLVNEPPTRNGNAKLFFEQFSVFDYGTLHIDPGAAVLGAVQNPNQEALNQTLNGFAGELVTFLLLVGIVSVRLLGWSMRVDLIGNAGGPFQSVVGQLSGGFYQPLLPLIFTLLAGWLIYVLMVKRRTSQGFGGIAWALLVFALAAVYFAAPGQVLSQTSYITGGIGRGLLGMVGAADQHIQANDPTVSQGAPDDAETRLFSNRYWQTFVYTPWSSIQFGKPDPISPNGDHLGVELLKKNAGQQSNFDADFQQMPQAIKDYYNGRWGDQRLAAAALYLALSFVAAAMFLAAAAIRLLKTIKVLILLLVVPIVLLVALHPGMGRQVLVKWFELFMAEAFGIVLWSLLLGLMLIVVDVASLAAANGGALVACCAEVLAMVAILTFRKPLFTFAGQVAQQKVKVEHVSKLAPATHGALGRTHAYVAPRLAHPTSNGNAPKPLTSGNGVRALSATKIGKAATAGKTAAGGAGALAGPVAVGFLAAQAGVRGIDHAKRKVQGSADTLFSTGHQVVRPGPHRPPRPARRVPAPVVRKELPPA